MLWTLLRNRMRATASALRGAGWAQGAVVGMFAVVGLLLFVGAFFFFLRAFLSIRGEDFAAPILARYVLEASFAFVLTLGVASFLASSAWLFYRDDELDLLMSLPVPPERVFGYRLVAASVASSWPVLLVAVPALGAYFVAQGAVSLAAFLFIIAVVALFTIGISLTGAILSFAFAPLTRALPAFLRWVAETAAFLWLMYALGRQVIPRGSFALLFGVTDAASQAQADATLTAIFSWVPSTHVVRVVLDAAGPGGGANALRDVAGLAVMLGLLAALLAALAKAFYLRLWQSYQARDFAAKPHDVDGFPAEPRRAPFPRVFRLGHGFLLEKDLIMLVRDGSEMSRAAFIAGLMALAVLALRGVSGMSAVASPALFIALMSASFGVVGYLALTFCMRFAFPAFSLETRGAWAVLTSPLHAHELYSWKYFFWTAVTLLLTVPATVVVCLAFGLPWALACFMVFAAVCASGSLVAITLGQGTLFPHFRETDPDSITTTPAGLAATGLSMGYLYIVARYVSVTVTSFLAGTGVPTRSIFGVLIVSVALIVGYSFLVMRRLDAGEVVA